MVELLNNISLLVSQFGAPVVTVLAILLPLGLSYHIIMTKNDVRAAIGWVGLVWLVPFVGAVLYFILGINRIQRKAVRARLANHNNQEDKPQINHFKTPALDGFSHFHNGFLAHVRLVDNIGRMPMTLGNHIKPLRGAAETFPAILEAIDGAKKSIVLASFIFGSDDIGRSVSEALIRAAERGVVVRVLIDGVGEFYNWPFASRALQKAGVKVVRFNKSLLPWKMAYFNLRNHRKIIIVDGKLGFTGGMNLRFGRGGGVLKNHAIRDYHFSLTGPIVEQMMMVFLEDWKFSTGESVKLASLLSNNVDNAGDGEVDGVLARGLPDGPDEDLDKVSWVLQSILGASRESVKIVTPYFLPDRLLLKAINFAALRGVDVEIYLPEENNLPFVSWASQAQYDKLIKSGCKIFLTEPPFDHSKLMVVDGTWLLFGSTNWDPRSLRLNFEFNVECFDKDMAQDILSHIAVLKNGAKRVSMDMLKNTPAWVRLRNGVAWLFSPYL
ncbi:MAG: PLDc N-terminal domain-containing protein [Sphingomonadales bacterium]|nr:PLDc N-terminal domain-containing protein [Sphingomonadales bacterium]